MKKLFAISLAIFFLAISNLALAQSNFDGIYSGLAAGYARGKDKGLEYKNNGSLSDGVIQQNNPEGFSTTVFAGANFVVDKNILLGVEVDYERRNHKHTGFQEFNNAPMENYPVETKVRNTRSL